MKFVSYQQFVLWLHLTSQVVLTVSAMIWDLSRGDSTLRVTLKTNHKDGWLTAKESKTVYSKIYLPHKDVLDDLSVSTVLCNRLHELHLRECNMW